MGRFIPKIYQKSIFDIDYDKLKSNGITCIIFDLDNTIGFIKNNDCSHETKKLIKSLSKDFLVLICSNNTKGRVNPFLEELGVSGFSLCFKPSTLVFRKISRKYGLERDKMCLIGDQLITDVLAANRYGVTSILVDPLSKKDLMVTKFSRKIEDLIIKFNTFERGKYYG